MRRLTTLGAIDLRDELGGAVREVLAQPKRIALLVFLAVEGRRGPVPRDRLLALFWPESDEPRARNALSQALHHLRQALGAEALVSSAASVGVAADALWCDAWGLDDALAADDVDAAFDLYGGEFCPGLAVSGAAELEEWMSATRRDQRRRVLALARRGVQRLTGAGDLAAAARVARRAMALMPDDERDVRVHLEAVERAGDATEALALYDAYARRLAVQLETQPAPETVALAQAIRRRRAEAPATAPVAVPVVASASPTGAPAATPSLAPRPPRARRVAAVAALAVLGAALALSPVADRALRGATVAEGAEPSRSAIAVFPFTVRGGDSSAMLGDGLTDLLSAKLEGLDEVRAIDPRSTIAAAAGRTPDPARADTLSRTLGARYFVLGGLVERAGRLQLDGTLYETGRTTQVRARASVSGDTAALFALVDDLAGRLLATLLGGRDPALASLASVTTSSLPALKAYLRGERELRAGLDAQAGAAFREAVALDPSFALAEYRLAMVANWVSVPGAADPAVVAARAAQHAEQLSPLGRDLLEAYRAYKAPSLSALGRYRALVQAHPDQVEAWYMLGETLFHYGPLVGEPLSAARMPLERALALDPEHAHAQLHLARLLAREGGAAFEAFVPPLLARYQAADRALELRALIAWTRRDSAATATVVADARGVDQLVGFGLMQAATTYALDLRSARAIARGMQGTTSNPIITRYLELIDGTIALGLGEWSGATVRAAEPDARARLEAEVLASVEPLLAVAPARLRALRARVAADHPYAPIALPSTELPPVAGAAMRHHLLALLDLRLGEASRAQRDSLEALAASSGDALAASLVISTRAEVLRAAGRTAEALAVLEGFPFERLGARAVASGARERFARAELLRALGRDAEAARWYGTFPAYYDLALLAPAQLRLGQIAERAGQRADARRAYAEVVRWWGEGDAVVQGVVREARAGLGRMGAR